MKDEDKTKGQLINELIEMRQRITELEILETKHKRAEESEKENRPLFRLASPTIFDHP